MATVGVAGVGRIGTVLVGRLVEAGHHVVATDIRAERRDDVVTSGAQWARDVATVAASCPVVFTVLPGSPELRELVLGDSDFLSTMEDGAVWIDMTSASVELGQQCARVAEVHGVAYLDAPIGGGVAAMRDGTVTLHVGGDLVVLQANAPILRAFASTVHHVGGPGMGYLNKLLINLMWFGHSVLTSEALLLAQHHGQAPGRTRELLLGSAGDSAYVRQHLPALLAGDYLRDFGLDRCVEELDSVERTAGRAHLPHPLTSVIAEVHRLALQRFGAVDGELMATAWLEEQAGTELRRNSPLRKKNQRD
ncbi:NAD(P)-dependent oxidoreductase [Actinocrispum sp. NPDC049592]|uniref:NAD(P)-dependent oxidoreductase n=1 Tax=Actinocrispum sp. NPDC049592 TaxID=3154835 RepID=UPI0034196662